MAASRLAILLVPVLLAAAQERLDPQRHPWMRWKEGTAVKWGLTGEGAPRLKQEIEMSITSMSAEGYTLSYRVTVGETVTTTEFKDSSPQRAGEEKLTYAGKEVACTIWKSSGQRGDKKSETRFWIAEGVRVPLRIEVRLDDKPFSEFAAVAPGGKVEAAGRTFECVKMAGKLRFPDDEIEVTAWASPEVPGFLVKQEFTSARAGAKSGSTQVVVEVKEGR